jgi:uracil-DNA glycosylase
VSAWVEVLADAMDAPSFGQVLDFVEQERQRHTIYPPPQEVFSAFDLTPFEEVKVLVLGQDPYHGAGQAHGLSFSVKPGIKLPPSLKNIYKELESDLGASAPGHGHLVGWARQGVMMLNAVLTVREKKPNSHKNQGWETFTDAVISTLSREKDHVVFLLWGGYAKKKAQLIDHSKHTIITSAHPSPLSARNGFFGSKPFSRINEALRGHQQKEIDWTAL